jgi:hypothetical protein
MTFVIFQTVLQSIASKLALARLLFRHTQPTLNQETER